jgi:cytochrome c oxidase cbb3-type subunit 2
MYDHPFQWGSKRIGPDLARVGGKYSNDWHYAHLTNPQALVPESLMPRYAFLARRHELRYRDIQDKLRTLRVVGVPYTDARNRQRQGRSAGQANPDRSGRVRQEIPKAALASGDGKRVTEMDALVAYLQVLGTMVNFADTSEETCSNRSGAMQYFNDIMLWLRLHSVLG